MSFKGFFRSRSSSVSVRRRQSSKRQNSIELLEARLLLSADPLNSDPGEGEWDDLDAGGDDGSGDGGSGDGGSGDTSGPGELAPPELPPEVPDPVSPGPHDFSKLTDGVDYVTSSIIVRPNAGLEAELGAYRSSIGVSDVRDLGSGFEAWTLDTLTVEEAYHDFLATSYFDVVEPNYYHWIDEDTSENSIEVTTPDDTNYPFLYGMRTAKVDQAWDIHTGNFSTVIGISDTGTEYRHPDLYENIWLNQGEIPPHKYDPSDGLGPNDLVDADGDGLISFRDLNAATNVGRLDTNGALMLQDRNGNGYLDAGDMYDTNETWDDGIDNDGNGYVDDFIGWDFGDNDNNPLDTQSHGTHVAGTAAARGNNNEGVTGVNWDAQIMTLKVGIGGSGSISTLAAIEALNYMVDMKSNHGVNVNVSNNSWGGGGPSAALQTAIQNSGNAGQLFVTSAGNARFGSPARDLDLNPPSTHSYPGSYTLNNIINVGNSDRFDRRSSGSHWGAISVDLFAPGENIYSTVPTSTNPNGYDFKTGTSMAAPMVAGAAALIFSHNPALTAAAVRSSLLTTVDTPPDLDGLSFTNGRLNLFKAMDPPRIDLSPVATAIIEGTSGTTTDFMVSLTPAGAAITSPFSVTLSTRDGSATVADNDYVGSTQVFNFSPAMNGVQHATFTVNGDGFLEVDENFFIDVVISSPDVVLGGPSSIPVTITNDDTPLGLAVAETNVDGFQGGDFTFTHSEDGIEERFTEEIFNNRRDTKFEQRWLFHVPTAAQKFFNITAGHTSAFETFNLEHSTDGGATWTSFGAVPFGPAEHQRIPIAPAVSGDVWVRAIDSGRNTPGPNQTALPYDPVADTLLVDWMYFETNAAPAPPVVKLAVDDANASEENTDPGTFRISLIDGTRATPTVVPIILTGTATRTGAGQDYTTTNVTDPGMGGQLTVTIPANQQSVDVTITPIDNVGDFEETETVTMIIDPSIRMPGEQFVGTVTITDNDQAPFTARTEIVVTSVRTGSVTDTQIDDDKEEVLIERRIDDAHTSLTHLYTFQLPNVAGDITYGFDITAFREGPVGDDNFIFELSLDNGATYTHLITISDANEGILQIPTPIDFSTLPGAAGAGANFNVLVRVRDTNSAAGDTAQSSVRINHMEFTKPGNQFQSTSSVSSVASTSSGSSDSPSSSGDTGNNGNNGPVDAWLPIATTTPVAATSSPNSEDVTPAEAEAELYQQYPVESDQQSVDDLFAEESWFEDLYI